LKAKTAFWLQAGDNGSQNHTLIRPQEQMVIFITEKQAVQVLQRDRLVVGIVDRRQFDKEETVIVSKFLKGG
jgi:hypothetical protein